MFFSRSVVRPPSGPRRLFLIPPPLTFSFGALSPIQQPILVDFGCDNRMSDFGSLLNQFQRDAKSLDAKNDEYSENERAPRKRARVVDAATFPPTREVYCVCPAGVQTGGPEALHQLCDEINRSPHSVSAFMLYVRSNGRTVTHAFYAKKPTAYRQLYDAPVVTTETTNPLRDGDSDQLLIWPECWTDEMLEYLRGPEPCPCAIWWLSVNNNTGKFQEWHRKDILHLYQSEYAREYITKKKAKYTYRMTEYISLPPSPGEERTIDVLYNPLKGIHYTDAIRKRSGSLINFRPIGSGLDGRDRVSPEEVRQMLKRAKVYIDFGPHPGMDRLPREAALAGCCVVTNREGAAQYQQDVPLPSRYKIQAFAVDAIHRLLLDLLDNFDERSKDFDEYREWIRGQRKRMTESVASFLDEVVEKRKKNIR